MLKRSLVLYLCVFMAGSGLFGTHRAFGLSISEEERLSREFMKMVRQQYQFIEDPLITEYVRGIGDRIVRVLPEQPFEYRFFVIQNDDFNAFASPAGNIFINSGLIAAIDSEDELAGIVGHEIAHVACRHISAMIEKSKTAGIATLAGIAAGIFLGMGGAAEVASAVTMGSFAAGQSAMLAYSRENEMQADQVGLKYLEAAGYDSLGLLTSLKKMRGKQWFGSEQIPTYLLTHPASEERIAYLDVYFSERAAAVAPLVKAEAESKFNQIHGRLIALYVDENLAKRYFKSTAEKTPDDPNIQYGLALLSARAGNRADAVSQLKKALADRAMDPYILRDLGKLLYLDGEYEKAIGILEGTIYSPPYDPEYHFYLARAKMDMERFGEAKVDFEYLLKKTPRHLKAMFYLGETYHKLERSGDAHYYLGRYYRAKGDLRNALFHMEKALKEVEDPNRKEEIEKILKKIRREIKEALPIHERMGGRLNRR